MVKDKVIKNMDNGIINIPFKYYIINSGFRNRIQKIISDDVYFSDDYIIYDDDKKIRSVLDLIRSPTRANLSAKSVSDITDLANTFLNNKIEASIGVSFNSKIDWKPGDLGESPDSCWWGSKSRSRKMHFANGGFAVKIYTYSGIPIGRCWGMLCGDNLVLFNLYTNCAFVPSGQMKTIAAAIAYNFGVDYKAVRLLNNGRWDRMHINLGSGYIIGNDVEDIAVVDLFLKEEEFVKCVLCKKEIEDYENHSTEDAKGRIWCDTCADKHLDVCNYDMGLYYSEEMKTGPDGLKYYQQNIGKVPHFVYSNYYSNYLLKKDAKCLGNIKGKDEWVKSGDNLFMCDKCKKISPSRKCVVCMKAEEVDAELSAYKVKVATPQASNKVHKIRYVGGDIIWE